MRIRLVGCAALLVAGMGFVPPQAAAAEGTTCMVYSEVSHDESRSLDVKLVNDCDRTMACSVDWTVTCAKSSKLTHNEAVLESRGEHGWNASAASCKDDWSISTTWHCNPK